MKKIDFTICRLSLIAIIFTGNAYAQNSQESIKNFSNSQYDGLAGLVVSNTFSLVGNQFYQLFSLSWSQRPESERHSISLVESRGRQRISQVAIYSSGRAVHSVALPVKQSALQAVVDQAIDAVATRLLEFDLEANGLDPDIAVEGI
jgi:hypothetical protein